MTNEELNKWVKNGAVITKDEYLILEELVHESILRMVEAHINGSKEFNRAKELELDRRHELIYKLNYLGRGGRQ